MTNFTNTNEIDVVLSNDISGLFPEMTLIFQNDGVHIRFLSAEESDPREYFLAVEGDGSDEDAARKVAFARQEPEAFCLRYADAMRALLKASRAV